MSTQAKISATILAATVLFMSVGGCGNVAGAIMTDQGDALRIDHQRPPEEALNNFRTFIRGQGMEVESTDGNSIRTAPGNLNAQSMRAGNREVRMRAVAEPTSGGSALIVIADYSDPTSGEWMRANSNVGALYMPGEAQSTEKTVFEAVKHMLASNYGTENIEVVSADFAY